MATSGKKRFATSIVDPVTDGNVRNREVSLKTKTASKRKVFDWAKTRPVTTDGIGKNQSLIGKVGAGARKKALAAFAASPEAQKRDWRKDKEFIQATRAAKELRVATRAKGGRLRKDQKRPNSTEHFDQTAAQ